MQLELAELDQVFTAKSIDRGVQDTCSTGSTGRISGIGITGTSTGTTAEYILEGHSTTGFSSSVSSSVAIRLEYCSASSARA